MAVVLRLAAVDNLGPVKARKLLERLKSEETELEYLGEFDQDDLMALGLTANQAEQFLTNESAEIADQLVEHGLSIVTVVDSHAPVRLLESKGSAWYFYVGRLELLNTPVIGFSGSRDASDTAHNVTREIATEAIRNGFTVLSGGARGIDSTAHDAAYNGSGNTVFVLPQGLATWRFTEEFDPERMLVISEFMPFEEWGMYRAMQRNKSIVHLSDILIVPQSGVKGGTWNAAEYAIKQKRPIGVIDFGQEYPGNEKLIELGASPLEWGGAFSRITEIIQLHGQQHPSQTSLF